MTIQLSEIKPSERGFADPARADFPAYLYDYASRPYGRQLGLDEPVSPEP